MEIDGYISGTRTPALCILYNKLLHTASDGSLIQWPFFKVNPNTLDDIFAVKADSTWETDQFLVNAYVGCKVVRPLSRDGVPY